MRLKSPITAALALLAAGICGPASADLKLFEPYGGIYSARTFLGSASDTRPKDAVQNQTPKGGAANHGFAISPLFADSNGRGTDLTSYGGTIGYANSRSPRHPWQIQGEALNNDVRVRRGVGTDILQLGLTGKYVLFQPEDEDLPVVSFVGRWVNYEAFGQRYDLLIAADQKVGRRMFATANAGWASISCDCSHTAMVAGLGLTYVVSPRLSLSGDYTLSNAVDGSDLWTVAASYAFSRNSILRIGGGKNSTLGQNRGLIFANYVFKFN